MFYAGARFVTTGHSFRTFDWGYATELVDALLRSYDLDGVLEERRNGAGRAE
jgi:4-hydroxyphenylacetate 3-monooxygenase